MANIQKRGDGSWFLTVNLGRGADGRYIRRTKTVHCRTKKEAESAYGEFRAEVEAGAYIAPSKMTFTAFVDEWKEKYATRELGAKTLENYMIQINNRLIPEFGHLRLDQIKPMHVVTFLDSLKGQGMRSDGKDGVLSSSMVQYVHRVLKNVLSRSVDWGVIKSNPMDGVGKPKVAHKEMSVFDDYEAEKLFVALRGEKLMWRVMIGLALTTGLRKGELLGLEWKNVDLDTGVIDVMQSLAFVSGTGYLVKEPKTRNSIRKVAVPQSMIPELKALKQECVEDRLQTADLWEGGERFFVFSAWNGKPLYPSSVKNWWGRFIRRNKLRYIRFHDLRHTSATLLINHGVHAKVISERLGHGSITTTMNVYGHALKTADQAAADKFDNLFTSDGALGKRG